VERRESVVVLLVERELDFLSHHHDCEIYMWIVVPVVVLLNLFLQKSGVSALSGGGGDRIRSHAKGLGVERTL